MTFTYQINDDVVWNKDKKLLDKADRNKPEILKSKIQPVAIVEILPDEKKINGYKSAVTKTKIQHLPQVLLKRDDSIILDLGDHYVGTFAIDIQSIGSPMDAPLFLKVKFAEVAAEIAADSAAYDGWLSRSWIQEEYIHLDVLPTTLKMPRRYSCRFIELSVVDTSPKWQVSFQNPVFTAESSVTMEQLPKDTLADAELEAICNVSVKTLMDCMQDVFEDGPKRDRRLWLGDLRLQALADYYTFNDVRLIKRGLYLFGGMTTSEEKIPANVFITPQLTPDDTFLFDYSLFFVTTLFDYIQHTNDIEVLEDLYPVAKKQIDLALLLVTEQGKLCLQDEWPVFIDWSNDFKKNTAGHGVMIYALKRFVELAKRQEDVQLQFYQEKLAQLVAYAKDYLFDATKNLFIVAENEEINIVSQVWMILSEIMPPEMNKKILENTVKTLFPIEGIATPYTYHHVVEAFCIAGMKKEAVTLIKDYWGKMIDMGADTFWEAFKPEDPNFSPYGSPIVNSYCHAWSCTPPYLIRKYLLTKINK